MTNPTRKVTLVWVLACCILILGLIFWGAHTRITGPRREADVDTQAAVSLLENKCSMTLPVSAADVRTHKSELMTLIIWGRFNLSQEDLPKVFASSVLPKLSELHNSPRSLRDLFAINHKDIIGWWKVENESACVVGERKGEVGKYHFECKVCLVAEGNGSRTLYILYIEE